MQRNLLYTIIDEITCLAAAMGMEDVLSTFVGLAAYPGFMPMRRTSDRISDEILDFRQIFC